MVISAPLSLMDDEPELEGHARGMGCNGTSSRAATAWRSRATSAWAITTSTNDTPIFLCTNSISRISRTSRTTPTPLTSTGSTGSPNSVRSAVADASATRTGIGRRRR